MPTPVFDVADPVLVTGANGYLAGWLVKRLLEQGATVHATARDPDNAAKVAHLKVLADGLPGVLKLYQADLLVEGSFAEAMVGCGLVFHTASPFTTNVRDAQRDLVDPAVRGTRNVLEQANRTETVKRVVLTSSCAAIFGDQADIAGVPGGVLTEAIWNTSSTLTHQPYSYSKTMAEGAAWQIAGTQEQWKLVVINPGLVVGPGLSEKQSSESFNLVRQLGDGAFKAGVPAYEIGMVDVRDVAEAHLRAGFIPQAEGRHIVFEKPYSFLDLAQVLRAEFGGAYPFPRKELPKWLLWLVGPMVSNAITRKMAARSFGFPWKADNSKSIQALGLSYRPVSQAVIEMFQQLIDSGQIPKA